MDEYGVNVRSAYRHWINLSVHALESSFLSFLGDPTARKAAVNKTPWYLLRRGNCDRLGYDLSLPTSAFSHKATLYVYFVLIIVGITCNILGLRVFVSKEMRNSSTHIYLMVLAVSDSLYLVFLFLSRALEALRCLYFPKSSFDIYNQSDIACKGIQYFIDLCSDYSAGLILAFTIERFVACYHAVFFRHKCTAINAKIICAALFVLQAISIAPHHIMYIKHFTYFNVCSISLEHEKEFTILYMTEAIGYRIIPVFLVAIINIFIIIKVWRMSRKRRLLRSSLQTSRISQTSAITAEVREYDKHAQITLVLILISTCYIITYIPVIVYFILQRMITNKAQYTEAFLIYCNFSRCLYVFGHSVNFFLYTTSAEMFRKQLKTVLCPCAQTNGYGAVQLQSSNQLNSTRKRTSIL